MRADRDAILAPASARAGATRSYLHPIAASLLELQHLAGNRAVASEIGSMRNGRVVVGVDNVGVQTHPSAPPGGVREIRESRGGGGLLGRTVGSVDDSTPPLLRVDQPVQTDKGWTARAMPTRAPEPFIEQWWPTAGRHEMFPHVFLEISQEWADRIKAGEEEHASDHILGWQATWGTIAETVGELAAAPGREMPTEAAARKDVWKRFVAALPADLRPAGDEPSDAAQETVWGFDPKTTVFRKLYGATKARDDRGWHTTTSELDHQDGNDEYRTVGGSVRIGEVSSEDLIGEFRGRAARGR